MTIRARRWFLVVAALILLTGVFIVRIRGGMADFSVNYRAGQRLAAGETLYQTADGHYMFKYFPFSALIYLPLSALPLDVAKAIWFALCIGGLYGMFRLARQLAPGQGGPWLSILPGLILAKYFLHELRLGQINILVAFVLLLAVRSLTRAPDMRHAVAAGALIGLATALKPYAALLVPYLVLTRRWTSAACALGVLVVGLALPSFFYGIEGNLDVLRQWALTLSQSTPDLLTNSDNVSVVAFFTKWTGDPARALALTAGVLSLLAILMLAVVVKGRGRDDGPALECAMALTLIPLVSPLGWDYTFLMSLLAVTLLVGCFNTFPRPAQILLAANFAVIALAVYDLLGRQAYAIFMQWSVTTVNFLVVVGALAYLRFRSLR